MLKLATCTPIWLKCGKLVGHLGAIIIINFGENSYNILYQNIKAAKKGAATLLAEKVVKPKVVSRDGCDGRSMAKNLIATILLLLLLLLYFILLNY